LAAQRLSSLISVLVKLVIVIHLELVCLEEPLPLPSSLAAKSQNPERFNILVPAWSIINGQAYA